jgi:CheY-like chemotaxis protein
VKRTEDRDDAAARQRRASDAMTVPAHRRGGAGARPATTPAGPAQASARPAVPRDLEASTKVAESLPKPPEPPAPPDPERVQRASLAQLRDELRTPANAIVGYSRALFEDAALAHRSALRADLEKIRTAGELFLSRLEDLLNPDHPTWDRQSPNRQELLSRMRHDLRTPLNAIIGYSELILEEQIDPAADEAMAGDVRRILAAGRQVLATIEEVVRFAATGRAEGGGLVRASALAQGVLAKLRPLPMDATAVPVRQGRLLVVDDVEANRDLISHQLARQGYTVSVAANGREALDMLTSHEFDLLLLDIFMPEMDGVEVLQRVKSDPALRELPVIVISALDEVDSVVRCIDMGAEDFVSKPFDPVLLGARIGTILEVRRLRDRERAYADALRREQEWVDRLLERTFPAAIAEKVKVGETGIVESTPEATVLVAGFQGAASLARGGPSALVDRLGELFTLFDRLADAEAVETVKTTGQCYLAVVGLPTSRADHARVAADLALAMQDEARRFTERANEFLRLRVGIHTGPVIAGLISSRRLAFDVWGDGVETANQLQLHAGAGTIQVSPATYAKLRESYAFVSRGVVDIPGKGQMRTYLLQGKGEAVSAEG